MNERTWMGGLGVLIAALAGCGGAGDAPTPSDPEARDAASATDAPSAPSPRDAAATGDAGVDAAPISDGAALDLRIDPIVVGHAWTYDVTTFGSYPLCPSGEHIGTALSEAAKDGKDHAILVESACANAGASYYAVDGDVVMVDVQGTWVLALDAPVAEGHTWTNGVSSFTWHDAGSVTVPAGTFHDCWRATENVAYESFTVFCRGVGPVRWYTKNASGDGFEAVLRATSF